MHRGLLRCLAAALLLPGCLGPAGPAQPADPTGSEQTHSFRETLPRAPEGAVWAAVLHASGPAKLLVRLDARDDTPVDGSLAPLDGSRPVRLFLWPGLLGFRVRSGAFGELQAEPDGQMGIGGVTELPAGDHLLVVAYASAEAVGLGAAWEGARLTRGASSLTPGAFWWMSAGAAADAPGEVAVSTGPASFRDAGTLESPRGGLFFAASLLSGGSAEVTLRQGEVVRRWSAPEGTETSGRILADEVLAPGRAAGGAAGTWALGDLFVSAVAFPPVPGRPPQPPS